MFRHLLLQGKIAQSLIYSLVTSCFLKIELNIDEVLHSIVFSLVFISLFYCDLIDMFIYVPESSNYKYLNNLFSFLKIFTGIFFNVKI